MEVMEENKRVMAQAQQLQQALAAEHALLQQSQQEQKAMAADETIVSSNLLSASKGGEMGNWEEHQQLMQQYLQQQQQIVAFSQQLGKQLKSPDRLQQLLSIATEQATALHRRLQDAHATIVKMASEQRAQANPLPFAGWGQFPTWQQAMDWIKAEQGSLIQDQATQIASASELEQRLDKYQAKVSALQESSKPPAFNESGTAEGSGNSSAGGGGAFWW